jgi:hypothetical protein
LATDKYLGLRNEVKRYSTLNGYQISDFTPVICVCKREKLLLTSDDNEGAAFADCPSCNSQIDIQDSRNYAENPVQNICNCGSEELLLGVGIAKYENSDDVRWVYVGGLCPKCGLSGVYVDWNER